MNGFGHQMSSDEKKAWFGILVPGKRLMERRFGIVKEASYLHDGGEGKAWSTSSSLRLGRVIDFMAHWRAVATNCRRGEKNGLKVTFSKREMTRGVFSFKDLLVSWVMPRVLGIIIELWPLDPRSEWNFPKVPKSWKLGDCRKDELRMAQWMEIDNNG